MKEKPREEDPSIDVITCSGMTTKGSVERADMESLICKVANEPKVVGPEKEKETSVAAQKY